MRTRQRTIVNATVSSPAINGSYQIAACNSAVDGPTSYTMQAFSVDTDVIHEVIADATGRTKSNPVRHRWKHVQSSTATRQLIAPRADGNGGRVIYNGIDPVWVPSFRNWLGDIDGWSVNAHATESPPRWTIASDAIDEISLKQDCIEKAAQLKADVLLNLIEANQMWPAVKSLSTCMPEMARNWKSIRKLVRTASGSYLAWKFGVSPILQDSIAIVKHMDRLKSDLKAHADGKPFRVSRVASVAASFNTTPYIEGTFNNVTWGKRTYSGEILNEPTIRYVLVAKPKLQYRTELFQKLDYALSRFATSPASLAWELVPFSFVVDWFVDIRGALETIDKALGHEPFELVAFSRSYSYDLISHMWHEFRETCAGASLGLDYVGSVRNKHYERQPVSSTTSAVRWKPRFGKNQAGISAALIGQQLTKLSAKR